MISLLPVKERRPGFHHGPRPTSNRRSMTRTTLSRSQHPSHDGNKLRLNLGSNRSDAVRKTCRAMALLSDWRPTAFKTAQCLQRSSEWVKKKSNNTCCFAIQNCNKKMTRRNTRVFSCVQAGWQDSDIWLEA
jgi:hypothetical protein